MSPGRGVVLTFSHLLIVNKLLSLSLSHVYHICVLIVYMNAPIHVRRGTHTLLYTQTLLHTQTHSHRPVPPISYTGDMPHITTSKSWYTVTYCIWYIAYRISVNIITLSLLRNQIHLVNLEIRHSCIFSQLRDQTFVYLSHYEYIKIF